MYKRRREQEDLKQQWHIDDIHEEAQAPNMAGVAGGSIGEATAVGEEGSSPRMYACLFCRRGFTSAQALGGHMNVHRRDRALLRQSALQVTSASNNNIINDNVNNLQPHSHVDDTKSSNFYVSAGLSLLPYDHQPAAAAASDTSQNSSFVCHVGTSVSRENYRPEHWSWHSSKTTHIMDQSKFNVDQVHKTDDDDDGVDLELRLGEKP